MHRTLAGALMCLALACPRDAEVITASTTSPSQPSATPTPRPVPVPSPVAPSASGPPVAPSLAPSVAPSAAPNEADADPWVELSEADMRRAVVSAQKRAEAEHKLVLLEFIAPWCADCREVVRLSADPAVLSVKRDKYVSIYVNLGKDDRHEWLRQKYSVHRIATLLVLTPDGKKVAQTTLEPKSKRTGLTSAALAAWLLSPS